MIVGNTFSNNQVYFQWFSLWKHSLQYVGNDGIYSVGRDMVYQIWQNSKTECFAGISWEGLTCEILLKTSCHHLSWLFAFQSCVELMAHFARRLLTSYPRKLLWSSICLESSHSFSHTTYTMKSHIKYRVHKIEENYNQIWHGIKANTK